MLNIRQVKHLARALGTEIATLREVTSDSEKFYNRLILVDPAKPNKRRPIVSVKGVLRKFQSLLYRKILLPKLVRSDFSHGGVSERDIKTNFEPHQKSRFVFKTDISNFYPTIHYSKVYNLFSNEFCCSPDVASLCTKICTHKHHLALGLITSPILADRLLRRSDLRIGAVCKKAGLVYTRFVDDISISGPYKLQSSGFEKVISTILKEDGFRLNPYKNTFGELSKNIAITNIRYVRGHLDVSKEYALELERQLADAKQLASRGNFEGPYYTEDQIRGRIHFVCWVNPKRKTHLLRKFQSISWDLVRKNAFARGLVEAKKFLRKV